jgi:hypothetical protein
MARTPPRPQPTTAFVLPPLARHGSQGGEPMGAASHTSRTGTTWATVRRLTLQRRRGAPPAGPQVGTPCRPAAAGRLALPNHAGGLDGLALVGPWRSAHHRRGPERPHACERRRGVSAPRPGVPLVERYDDRRALSRTAPARLQRLPAAQGPGLRALAGLQPAVGPAGLGGLRACRAGVGLLARRVRSAPPEAVAPLRPEVRPAIRVPRVGLLSEGPRARRRAVAPACPQRPHPLGPLPSRREAAKPLAEADRHAKKARQTRGRGEPPLARPRAGQHAPEAEVVRGAWAAGRRARPDAGRPPLAAAGRRRDARLRAGTTRRERGDQRGPCPRS